MNLKHITSCLLLLISLSVFSNQYLEWQALGPNNLGGITRSILVDRDNSNLLYAGSAGGGLYISYDAGENWEPYEHNELLNNCAIGVIKQAANGDIYISTGEPSFGFGSGFILDFRKGNGIFKITGPNALPILLPSTDPVNSGNSDFTDVNEMELDPLDANKMFVATDNGLLISNDGGAVWNNAITSPNANGVAYDVKISNSNTNIILATIGSYIYRSIDGGNTFTAASCTFDNTDLIGSGRKEIAISKSNSNYIYISKANFSGEFDYVIRSTDQGSCWEKIADLNTSPFDDINNPFYNSIGWYAQSLIVDPIDENKIYLGGHHIWAWNSIDGWKQLSSEQESQIYNSIVSPGIHNFHFDNNDILFVSGNNGVYKSSNMQDSNPTFESKSYNYITSNFFSIGADINGRVIGNQLNSNLSAECAYLNYPENNQQAASKINGSGLSYTEISHMSENIMFYGKGMRSSNKGISSIPFISEQYFSNSLWVTPLLLWEDLAYWESLENLNLSHQEKLDSVSLHKKARYYSGGSSLFMVGNPLELNKEGIERRITNFLQGVLSSLSTSLDGGILWAGSSAGSLIRVTDLNNLDNYTMSSFNQPNYNMDEVASWAANNTNIPWNPGTYISGIAVNPTNSNQVIISIASYNSDINKIYLSSDALSNNPTWTSIQYNFPTQHPVYDVIFDKVSNNTVYIATEIGVWSLSDINNSVEWLEENDGIGRCRVSQIKQEPIYERYCHITYISTYGKGLFRSVKSLEDNPYFTFCSTDLPDPEMSDFNYPGQQTFNCNPGTKQMFLEVNNVRALINNSTTQWFDLNSQNFYEVPKSDGSSSAKNVYFANGLWLGGIDEFGQLKVAASSYAQDGYDFWPGPIINGATESAICDAWNHLFEVTRQDVNNFLDDGTISQNLLRYPASNNPHLIDLIGADLPANESYFPFFDINNDGTYNPYDGDYPVITGDQSIHWILNDIGNEHTKSQGDAFGIEIKISAYAYNLPSMDTITFYRYIVTNKSDAIYEDFKFGMWVDPDLGNYDDDFIGVDTLNNLAYVYNGDDFDEGASGYGSNIPITGIMLLDGPHENSQGESKLGSFVFYNNDFTTTGHPESTIDFNNYLSAIWKNDQPITYGENGNNPNNPPTNFMYPSNPNDLSNDAWNECKVGNTPFDRRFVFSAKPITLQPDETVKFEFAVLTTFDVSYPCPDISGLQNLATEVQAFYDNEINEQLLAVNLTDKIGSEHEIKLVPNPTSNYVQIMGDLKFSKAVLFDLQGRKVAQYIVTDNQISFANKKPQIGAYILKVYTKENEVKVQKIVIE